MEDEEEEDQGEKEEEDQGVKEKKDQEEKEGEVEGEKADSTKASNIGLHEGNSTQGQGQRVDEAHVTLNVAGNDQQGVEEVLVQPAPTNLGGPDGNFFQSPRQVVVSKEAPTDCIGEEQLGTPLHCQSPFADKVATQLQLNTPADKVKPVGDTQGDALNPFDVAPVHQSATPPPANEGLQMPPTLASQIDENGLIVMERAVRLKEVRLREDQVKFKRDLLQFKIGQLALKRKFLQVGSPAGVVEEERDFKVGEGSKIARSSLATQLKDINGLVVKKKQTVKECTEVLEAMQQNLVDLLYKMNNAEGRLHSAKVQVTGLETIDGNDVHKFGLAEVQDSILELEKICHEIGEVRFELKAKAEHHKCELTKLHHYEACLLRMKQKTSVQMEDQEGSSLTFLFAILHCSCSMHGLVESISSW